MVFDKNYKLLAYLRDKVENYHHYSLLCGPHIRWMLYDKDENLIGCTKYFGDSGGSYNPIHELFLNEKAIKRKRRNNEITL